VNMSVCPLLRSLCIRVLQCQLVNVNYNNTFLTSIFMPTGFVLVSIKIKIIIIIIKGTHLTIWSFAASPRLEFPSPRSRSGYSGRIVKGQTVSLSSLGRAANLCAGMSL